MLPGKYNITIVRGSTFKLGLGAEDDNGNPIDFEATYINNPTVGVGLARMHIRPAWTVKPGTTLAAPLLELTTGNNRIVITGTSIQLILDHTVTADLTFDKGSYDLELVSGEATPTVDKLLYGLVTVTEEKTVE